MADTPYRTPPEPCTGCDALHAECVALQNRLQKMKLGSYPNQGNDRTKHACVFCGVSLYHAKPGCEICTIGCQTDLGHDLKFCNKVQTLNITPKTWFKSSNQKLTNVGCIEVPHLHRHCYTCKGTWIELSATAEKAINK